MCLLALSRPQRLLLMLWMTPPPARGCAMDGVLLRLPRFRGVSIAAIHDNRSRQRQVSVPGSRSGCRWRGGHPPPVEAALLAFFLKPPPCLVGIEACASSRYWSRELQALGHTVRLMPPAYVKPYVKRHKNEMADVEAICQAVTRANMRFVPTDG
jgi:hypothetical protein